MNLEEQLGWLSLDELAEDWSARRGGAALFQDLEAWAKAEQLLVQQE